MGMNVEEGRILDRMASNSRCSFVFSKRERVASSASKRRN